MKWYWWALVAAEQGWQGIQRRRRARQRNRFLMWLTGWAERTTDHATQITIERKGGR
jgi:hypothetical protein